MATIAQEVQDVLHLLIDVASGRRASLPPHEADKLHEQVTPGYNDQPLSEAELAQLKDLEDRKAREAAKAEGATDKPAAKGKGKAAADDEDAG